MIPDAVGGRVERARYLHETFNESLDGVLYVNPGQGYSSFAVSATIAKLTVE